MNKMTKVKILTGSLFGLAAVSLVGVAFSSWVIQSTNSETFNSFNVSVSNVSDKRLVISKITSSDSDIVFDAKESDTTGPIVWDGSHSEDLTFNFSFTISDVLDGQGKFKKDVGVNIKWDNPPAYSTLIGNNYITAPQRNGANALTDSDTSLFEYKTGEALPSDSSNGLTFAAAGEGSTDLTVTATYSFAWGSTFEVEGINLNPSEFATDENLSTVLTALEELRNLDGQKFTIILTSYVPPLNLNN